ncbi:hypothetical protein [Paenibacillus hexagrammi]|uniref:Uncharacterized protein n=1 Tax=Paenibacillus hexagrammi TaxID=2908839 RepID=A0ABY3SDE8_9BACL|nr:hypothetical protein [Paenibacillus sp. YPD9-1]UJF31961.1 hypothetical protein L0M14_19710 [Paenibacillus sp. YPD9-1]
MEDSDKIPLTLSQAVYTITQALGIPGSAEEAQAELTRRGLLTEQSLMLIANKEMLTNADTYVLIRDLKLGLTGKP